MATKSNQVVRRALLDIPVSTKTPTNAGGAAALATVASDDVIMVNAPRGFTLTLDDGTPVPVRPGVQNMPRKLAEHWYAKASGVVPYDPDAPDGTGQPA